MDKLQKQLVLACLGQAALLAYSYTNHTSRVLSGWGYLPLLVLNSLLLVY